MRGLAALVVLSPLWAQGVSLGVRGGFSITAALTADAHLRATKSRYIVGPLVEVNLWPSGTVGADFLVRRDVWELPITFLYRFRAPARPFLRGGVSFNRVFDVSGAAECGRGPFGEQFYCTEDGFVAELRHRSTSGLVVGGGLEFKVWKFRVAPEVRMTRWFDRNFGVRDSAVRSNLSQVSLLCGVFFPL